ncbi:radial spoke head 14 homolog isoform X2 [Cebus imitator]|uniref:radial spoke head 14 homolog isoform X2 n=1 Tax=Cebus imitator TaxID=2715852 RepID=UPI00080A00D6|nr:radial spoke head 14 homolog isoform X2 [Cebus imitator]
MAQSGNSMELSTNINAAQVTTAYGHRALPKLNEELQSEDLQTRQKALMALCDLMHDPEHIYKAMNIGCMENLKALLKDRNSMVRIKTTEVLHVVASHSVGRFAFLEHDIVRALSFLLNDPSPVCRRNLYKAYMQLVQVPRGAEEIISKGLIFPLVRKLQGEAEEEFQELILDTLVLCLREDATEALNSNVVPILKQKLISTNENIRSKAARALLNVREVCGPGGRSHWPASGAAALPHDRSAPECHQGPHHAGGGSRGPQGPAGVRAHLPCHGGGASRKASHG